MKLKVIVFHSHFGCDTGCCGHQIEIQAEHGEVSEFSFDHPYGRDFREFATKLAEEEVAKHFGDEHTWDLDWENCNIQEE